ncbi:hypothetical protein BCR43DRAFT_493207 [Syncephalastrum racemosum]|uniref:Uncharacterized protein n=1 Tax=Syncephalastrum racemosum TaxID=13706 RepID=A0A1X2HA79_SYNRA|nr:hypothetical protein BCR43DRAFT_493207 [Syncephalastrum racemosum]
MLYVFKLTASRTWTNAFLICFAVFFNCQITISFSPHSQQVLLLNSDNCGRAPPSTIFYGIS